MVIHGQTTIAKLKSAYNSLIIGRGGLGWQAGLWEIMGWESFGVVGFDLRPLVQGQTKIAKLKVLISRLLLVLEVCMVCTLQPCPVCGYTASRLNL